MSISYDGECIDCACMMRDCEKLYQPLARQCLLLKGARSEKFVNRNMTGRVATICPYQSDKTHRLKDTVEKDTHFTKSMSMPLIPRMKQELLECEKNTLCPVCPYARTHRIQLLDTFGELI